MDKVALVSLDIERGREVVEILERAKIQLAAALWAYLPEYEDWRLVISARQFDSPGPRNSYGQLHELLTAAGFTAAKTPPLMILPTDDPLVKALRRIFSKAKNVDSMRVGGQMLGNRFIEDAFVYKVS